MKKIALQDLYPMRVNPLNFTKGDTVKKIYMDNIQTPYVGVVSAVIPSTNKVEVQWPHGMGIEDPWDLIKVNPLINPPVVREDKAYKTYQNQKAQSYNADYCKRIQHYDVLNNFLRENVMPIHMHAASLYNQGYSKLEARQKLSSTYDSETILVEALNHVFNDQVNVKRSTVIQSSEDLIDAELLFDGNSDSGWKVAYKFGDDEDTQYFSTYRKAFDCFKSFEQLIGDLDSKPDASDVVAHVNRLRKAALQENDNLTEINEYSQNRD